LNERGRLVKQTIVKERIDKMDNYFTEGSFTFIIRGDDLKPKEITAKLNLMPSSVKLKGNQ
jgi:hypothetical protein